MIVFNLTENSLQFHGKTIPPNGGSVDIKGLKFIPDRDRQLEKDKILAFGSLPRWFVVQQEAKKLALEVEDAKKRADALATAAKPLLEYINSHTFNVGPGPAEPPTPVPLPELPKLSEITSGKRDKKK